MDSTELSRLLDELGQRLGPTGEYVFALAVRQVYINAAVAAVLLTLVIALGVIAGPRIYRWQLHNPTYGSRDLVALIGALIYGILLVIVAPLAFIAIPNAFNPEYAALRDIIGAVTGGR